MPLVDQLFIQLNNSFRPAPLRSLSQSRSAFVLYRLLCHTATVDNLTTGPFRNCRTRYLQNRFHTTLNNSVVQWRCHAADSDESPAGSNTGT